MISNLESSSKNVEENWKKYIENINLRNEKLILETIKNDTIKINGNKLYWKNKGKPKFKRVE